jgi:heme oxygenase (biliverdin-IX-beta and delta-forming)
MILEEIKALTSENHIRLENSQLLSAFSQQTVDRHSYGQILRMFYGYFHPLEKKINQVASIENYLPDYTSRRKSRLLLHDLQALGFSDPNQLPLCTDLPEVANEAQAFGCLYVMEGSTLGGKFIAHVLRKCLGIEASSGAAFFNGYGAETGTRWKTFQQSLLTFSEQAGQNEAIIASANQTFNKMERWISQSQVS